MCRKFVYFSCFWILIGGPIWSLKTTNNPHQTSQFENAHKEGMLWRMQFPQTSPEHTFSLTVAWEAPTTAKQLGVRQNSDWWTTASSASHPAPARGWASVLVMGTWCIATQSSGELVVKRIALQLNIVSFPLPADVRSWMRSLRGTWGASWEGSKVCREGRKGQMNEASCAIEQAPRSFGLISTISSHPAVFFSHNKPANSTFSTINQRNEQAEA
jgi:hypothetical protein